MDLSAQLTPLEGGFSGQTFVSEVAGVRSVVRIYPPASPRGLVAPELDAAVLSLVRGLLPVPEVLDVRRPDVDADQPGLLVTSWIQGLRGDLALADFGESERARMGASMGRVAATLAGMPTLGPGRFTDTGLSIEPWDEPAASGLPSWVAAHVGRLPGWDAQMRSRLMTLAEQAQELLDATERTCVVHSDLNPKNVLVDPGGDVVAVLDWEFAHSGHPVTDLGNVLRFERDAVYREAALSSYADLRGGDRDTLIETARAADLWGLVELAARHETNPVALRAERLLRAEVARVG